jgi:hypothetical protein
MKGKLRLSVIWCLLLLLPILGCQKEILVEEQEDFGITPAFSIIPDIVCNPVQNLGLISASGSTTVDYCSGGPCTTTSPWGNLSLTKGWDNGYTNPRFELSIALASSWYLKQVDVLVDGNGNISTLSGQPQPNSSWTSQTLSPMPNIYDLTLPMSLADAALNCYDLGLRLVVTRVSLFGQPVAASERVLYAHDLAGDPLSMLPNVCFDPCGPPQDLVLTQGNCDNCHAEITTTFHGCTTVDVTSCKPISSIVLVYDDCSYERFNNPSGTLPSALGNGKTISHIYVRSGCPTLANGPRPGMNANMGNPQPTFFPAVRFDGPCLTNCPY